MSLANNITVTFLGTTSGGGPTETRNCSSLVVDALGDGSLWMVDCAEGTVRQFAQQPSSSNSQRLRISSVNRIFITHMHADHSMGLITLLRNILGMAPDISAAPAPSGRPPKPPVLKVEIYGPVGVRAFIRTVLSLTHTRSADRYRVNELLMPGEVSSASPDDAQALHCSEVDGRDIPCGEDTFWRSIIVQDRYDGSQIIVDAGPIVHRDPCIGYIFSEKPRPTQHHTSPKVDLPPHPFPRIPPPTTVPRTLVILGDTSDPSALIPLITEDHSRTISLLVHEATDAYIPSHIDVRGTTGRNRNHENVKAKAIAKGHSTPGMAGEFARQIDAQRLALNHIGARFPAPPPHAGPGNFRYQCMREIEDQAMQEWQPINGSRAIAVVDFDRVVIPPIIKEPNLPAVSQVEDEDIVFMGTRSMTSIAVPGQGMVQHIETYTESRNFAGGRDRGRGGHGQHGQRGSFQSRGGHAHRGHNQPAVEGSSSGKKREHSGGNDRKWHPNDRYKKDGRENSNGKKPRRDDGYA